MGFSAQVWAGSPQDTHLTVRWPTPVARGCGGGVSLCCRQVPLGLGGVVSTGLQGSGWPMLALHLILPFKKTHYHLFWRQAHFPPFFSRLSCNNFLTPTRGHNSRKKPLTLYLEYQNYFRQFSVTSSAPAPLTATD